MVFSEESPESKHLQHKRQSVGPGMSKIFEATFAEKRTFLSHPKAGLKSQTDSFASCPTNW